jgi:hypothetical protein
LLSPSSSDELAWAGLVDGGLASATPAAPSVSNPAKAGTAYRFFILIPSFEAPEHARHSDPNEFVGPDGGLRSMVDCVTES